MHIGIKDLDTNTFLDHPAMAKLNGGAILFNARGYNAVMFNVADHSVRTVKAYSKLSRKKTSRNRVSANLSKLKLIKQLIIQ